MNVPQRCAVFQVKDRQTADRLTRVRWSQSSLHTSTIGRRPHVHVDTRTACRHLDRTLGCLVVDGVDCWSENTHLSFDAATRQYSNFAGVETWIPGWGTTDTMEYVDPSWTAWALGNVGVYARYMVDGLQNTSTVT